MVLGLGVKTKEQLSEEYSKSNWRGNWIGVALKDEPITKAFLAGFDVCEKISREKIQSLLRMVEADNIIIKDMEAEIQRLKDKYESKFLGRP